ncbi:MAG: hypothetical protein ABIJ41_07695 [Candidatus Omnitrophota bacterium]
MKQLGHKKRSFAFILSARGTILMEVLLTITILSVGLTFIIRSFITSLRSSVITSDYSTALLLVDNKMHKYLQSIFVEDGIDEKDSFEEPFEKYHYELTTQQAAQEGALSALSEVALKAGWTSGQKKNSINVMTYLFHIPQQ